MAKKRKFDRLNNLVNMAVSAVALVDDGANNKKMFLFKRMKGNTMNEKLAIKLLKACETEDERNEVLEGLDEDVRGKVEKALESELDVNKAGARFNKDALAILNSMKTAIDKLVAMAGPAKKEDKTEDEKPVKKTDDADKEISDDDFAKMVSDEIKYELLGEERPATSPADVLAKALKDIVAAK